MIPQGGTNNSERLTCNHSCSSPENKEQRGRKDVTEMGDLTDSRRLYYINGWLNRNCKLEISTAPKNAKSREPAYSHVLIQNKIDRQRVRFRESGRQTGRQAVRRLWSIVFGVDTRRDVGRRG